MSKFRKHLNKYFHREKKIINLKIKDREINEAIRNQGYIELEKPIPHGYNAEWVLRDDILNRSDASAYQEALDASKVSIWSKDKSFKYKEYKTKKWVVRLPGLKAINKERYDNLSVQAKKFFIEDTTHKNSWRLGFTDKSYRCTLSFELVVKITQSYITHRREHDNILYQMDAENEANLYRVANGFPWGGNSYDKFWNKLELKKEKAMAKKEIKRRLSED